MRTIGDAVGSESKGAPESATMAVSQRGGTQRAYAITSPLHDLYFERLCSMLEMLEHPVALAAPTGSLLVRDADDGTHGVLCAEKLLDGGWLLRDVGDAS